MPTPREAEHETFAALHDALGRALENIQTLASLRPDQPWMQIHGLLSKTQAAVYDLAMKGKS